MKNYLIVTDTTSAMNDIQAKKYGIELVSLSVLIDGMEYKDQLDITTDQLYQKLKEDHVPTTSQPNTGYLEELMKKWKAKEYDAIIVITCSSDLSGTWSGFNLVKNQLEMNNMYIYDSRQVGAPVMDMAINAKNMADQGDDVTDIFAMLEMKTKKSFSFLIPKDFKQLARGGRLSPMAAKMASILKVKALLYLKEDGSCVDKYAMSRTETKIIKTAIDKFKEDGVSSNDYTLYISHGDNEDLAINVKNIFQETFSGIDIIINKLPAVLTCHGGLGCIALHYVHKMK
ncbi:MAG: DegV family protein [Thomasclavelia sp.]|uniref:DegV family protein n=1 Tax=Thomasclavelia sp. TaxID=3025757 RepID=UPI0039A32F9A